MLVHQFNSPRVGKLNNIIFLHSMGGPWKLNRQECCIGLTPIQNNGGITRMLWKKLPVLSFSQILLSNLTWH